MKPQQIETIDIEKLRTTCQAYIDELDKYGLWTDDDLEHYIFEDALKAVFGEHVFEWVNDRLNSGPEGLEHV